MKILITGATSGIGKILARTLAFRNHKVYACCHTLEELKYASLNKEKNIEYLKLDIENESDYTIIKNLGIDCIINQAGIGVGGSLLDLDLADIKKNYEVNVFSTLNLCKYFIDYCYNEGRPGKILITSSIIKDMPMPFLGSYASTKSSLTTISYVLNKELTLSNINDIQLKLIIPGAYKTGFNQNMLSYISKSKYFKDYEKNYLKMYALFELIERKSLHTIVNKMVKAVEDNSSKFIYSSPISQRIFSKIYSFFAL